MSRIIYTGTHQTAAQFVRGQLAYMRKKGFDVTLVTSPGDFARRVAAEDGVDWIAIPMQREIDPPRDVIALWRLYRLFRKLRPDIVNAGTPKAALLSMLAARLAGVRIRVYTLHGLRLETVHGVKRFLLAFAERLTSACANRVVCVSESLREVYLKLRLASPEKTAVLGPGSANGIDLNRFGSTAKTRAKAEILRKELGIPDGVSVIGYVGRLTRDKGIAELFLAFKLVLAAIPDARLLLVGDFEAGDAVSDDCICELEAHPQVILSPGGRVAETAPYYLLMDVLALPSYREGFGNVVIEAGASGLPVVAFRTTGIVDSVQDGVTGSLVPTGDVLALSSAVKRYLHNWQLKQNHGRSGRARVERCFRQEAICRRLYEDYLQLLRSQRLAVPEPINSEQTVRESERKAA